MKFLNSLRISKLLEEARNRKNDLKFFWREVFKRKYFYSDTLDFHFGEVIAEDRVLNEIYLKIERILAYDDPRKERWFKSY